VRRVTSAVTDTHPLLFHAARSSRLGARSRELFAAAEAREIIIYVPLCVMWEVTLLSRAARVNLHRPTRAFFEDLFSSPSFQAHPMAPEQIFDAGELRGLTDPFDALICAAARDLGLPLVTHDSAIVESGFVDTIW
jgi:PIN domain nuclease of toxin-antitoxin system